MIEEKFCACPYCDAVFRLPEEKINQLSGMVRCGACRDVFDASTNLVRRSENGFIPACDDELNQVIGEGQYQSTVEEPFESNDMNRQAEESFAQSHLRNAESIGKDPKLTISDNSERQEEEIKEQILSIELPGRDEHLAISDDYYDDGNSSNDYNSEIALSAENLDPDHSPFNDVLQKEFDQPSLKAEVQSRNPFDDTDDPVQQGSEYVEPVIKALDFDPDESINLGMHRDLDEQPGLGAVTERVIFQYDQEGESELSELPDIDLPDLDQSSKPGPEDTLNTPTLSAGLEDTPLGRMSRSGVDEYINDRTNPFVSFSWMLVTLIFVFLFGMQIKYFFVERYAQHESYRPYLVGFCKIASCQLPPRQDPFRFTLTHTKIDLHPSQPGALRVTVKLVNEAKFAQPYPLLQLTLTDRVGRVVGRRTFTPESYLINDQPNMLGQGELASLLFDLARPHEKAVGFVVDIVTDPVSS